MSEKYFDYRTGPVNLLTGDVIDTSTTGVSFYNQFLSKTDAEYLKRENNLVGKIVYMTPQKYYELCGQYGFPGGAISPDSLKQQRSRDVKVLNHLKNVLTDYGHKFPLPYISIAERGQEGLHRMMVLGDMFGWNSEKYPVLLIEFADLERAEQEKQQSIINKHSSYIRYAIRQTLQYKFNDLEELKEQLQFDLDREFQYVDEVDKPVKFELVEDPSDPDYYIVKVGKASADIEKDSIKFIEIEDDIDLDDIDADDIELDDLEETEDFLKRYFGDNWRETNPELKKTFGIKEAVERLDLKQIDDAILSAWGATTPGEDCIFIHPSGTFINIYPKLDDHEDLCYWLEENGFGDNPEDPAWFVDEFKYIRCRNSLHLCFVELPTQITRQQLYSLEEWFETKVSTDYMDIEAPNGEWKHYNLDEYFPEDLIKIIKRFYSSGKLYEQK